MNSGMEGVVASIGSFMCLGALSLLSIVFLLIFFSLLKRAWDWIVAPFRKKESQPPPQVFQPQMPYPYQFPQTAQQAELTELRNAIEILAKEVKELKEKIKGEK